MSSKKAWYKKLKLGALSLAQKAGLLNLASRRQPDTGKRVYILTYHRVDTPEHRPWLDPAHISASPHAFRAHMNLISKLYYPVTMTEVLAAVRGESRLPSEAVLVTVDDGYRDFAEVLYPIAQEYGIQPTLFVPTAFVGSTELYWWDKLYQAVFWAPGDTISTPEGTFLVDTPEHKRAALKSLSLFVKAQPRVAALALVQDLYAQAAPPFEPQPSTLTWEELRALSRQGVTIAAHTHTHPILTRVALDEAYQEIHTSQEMVAQNIGSALPVFAYPDGKIETFNQSIEEALRLEGMEAAFTMLNEQADLARHHPLQLPRIGVWYRMTLPQLHWRLTRF